MVIQYFTNFFYNFWVKLSNSSMFVNFFERVNITSGRLDSNECVILEQIWVATEANSFEVSFVFSVVREKNGIQVYLKSKEVPMDLH